eukprot:gene60929-83342_t
MRGHGMHNVLPDYTTHVIAVALPIVDNSQDMAVIDAAVAPQLLAPGAIPAYLIRSHGLYGWGRDMAEAERVIEGIEWMIAAELAEIGRLQIFDETDGTTPLRDTSDIETIAAELAQVGVLFERWPTRDIGDPAAILDLYAPEIDRLKARGGYRSVDVMALAPDHPGRATLRDKFLSEHTHAEDEVRFFVDGEGLFTLHEGSRVFNMLCTAGDLIAVPAGMKHWFDMGAA